MKNLTEGKEWKVILNFAIPMLLGNVFHQLYNVVDSMIVGHFIGDEALASVGASFPVIFLLISLIIGITSGSTTIIAQYFGAKNYEKLKKSIDTINIVVFITSIIISVFGICYSREIFELIDLPEHLISQATDYLDIILIGFVTSFGFYGTSSILRGLGDSKTPLYFQIIATFVNIALDFLFVVYFEWGIKGVAAATAIAEAGAFLTAIIYLNRYHEFLKFTILNLEFDKKIFIQSVRIGLPSGFQNMFVSLGMMALYKIVNTFQTDTIAAYSVAGRIDSFAVMPAMNFAQAFIAFVGQNLGAKKLDRVKNGLFATIIMTSIISIFFTLIAFFFGEELMGMFSKSENVIAIGVQYLKIVSAFYITFSIMFSITSVFRGAGDTIIPMFITLFALWFIRIPVSYFLSLEYGYVGIWWGIPVAWIIGMIASYIYYLSGKWKTKVII